MVRDDVSLESFRERGVTRQLGNRVYMYTEQQILAAVERGLVKFSGFIEEIKASTPDEKFVVHVDRLLLNIYLAHKRGKYITKTQACRMIPAEHINTCNKYVNEAVRLGFIDFKVDADDKRRKNVVPTEEFLEYVGQTAQRNLDELRDIISSETPH